MNTTSRKTTSSKTVSPKTAEIKDVLGAARVSAENQEYMSRSRCADWLLDAFNASNVPVVRDEIKDVLADFSHGNIARADEFRAAIDRIAIVAMLTDV